MNDRSMNQQKVETRKPANKMVRTFFFAFLFLLSGLPTIAMAQFGGGNPGGGFPGGGGGFPGGGGGNGGGGFGGGGVGGISIDAKGVVSTFTKNESSQLMRKRVQKFLKENYEKDFSKPTLLRKVSLKQVEQAAIKATRAGEPIPQQVKYLYGLLRIDYLFIDAKKGDVILAGPAEGFVPDAAGRMRGASSGRPVLQLDDLLVAFRSAFLGGEMIGVSIDPVPERTAALQQYIRQNSSPTSRTNSARRYQKMGQVLGMQKVTLFGVPKNSHFAQVLVEADYRMKRISIGKEHSRVKKIRSQLSMLKPNGNSMQRWWFSPLYNPIEADEQELAFRLSGQRCQLMAQEEWTDKQGNRSDATFTRTTTQNFAKQFTEHFEELAEKSPVFAELQNCFDLAVVAALLRKQNAQATTGWKMEAFLDEKTLPIQTYDVPQTVPSAAMSRNAGRFTLGLVGGVTLSSFPVAKREFNRTHKKQLQEIRAASIVRHLEKQTEKHPGWWN